ncbi:MAG: class B sortase [Oscillospiraceae bacterium]|nr:class B sortase [Oscillospiraceae bacterium]
MAFDNADTKIPPFLAQAFKTRRQQTTCVYALVFKEGGGAGNNRVEFLWRLNMKRLILILVALAMLLAACQAAPAEAGPEPEIEPITDEIRSELPTESGGAAIGDIAPQFGAFIAQYHAMNEDTVGWLMIPGTSIDNAIVINPKGDPGFYTEHAFDRTPDPNGTFSTDFRVNIGSGLRSDISRNIPLYAHNFTDNPYGELFDQLKRFLNPEFVRETPYVFFSTSAEDMVWEVFAVFHTHVDFPYIIPDLDPETFYEVMNVALAASIFDFRAAITEHDRILTLTTCTFDVPGVGVLPFDVIPDYRFVVMARLVSPDETLRETATFFVNDNPLTPRDMPTIFHDGNDVVFYGGRAYFTTRLPSMPEMGMDLANATLIGEIGRNGIVVNPQDLDAVILPVGTRVLRHNENPDVLIAQLDGQNIPYRFFRDLN